MRKLLVGLGVLSITLFGCGNDETSESENVDVIMDANEFSRISEDELIGKVGEPDDVEEPYLSGIRYEYDHDLGILEFILHDDIVTRMNLYSNNWKTDNGEKLPYYGEDTLKSFNINELRDDAKKITSGESVLRVRPVSDDVAEFWVNFIDEDGYDLVKITYDLRPYE